MTPVMDNVSSSHNLLGTHSIVERKRDDLSSKNYGDLLLRNAFSQNAKHRVHPYLARVELTTSRIFDSEQRCSRVYNEECCPVVKFEIRVLSKFCFNAQ